MNRKRKYAWDVANKYQATKRRRTGGYTPAKGTVRVFVPRSYGTPLAVTERKYFDSEKTLTAVTSGQSTAAGLEFDPATLNSLFAPVQGDDFDDRHGRKVSVLKIKIRGLFGYAVQADQTAPDVVPFLRILLVQDKQSNSTQLNSEDVLLSTGTLGMQNPAFFGRFRVLKDKYYRVPPPLLQYDGTNMEQSGAYVPFKISHRFKKPVIVHYNAGVAGTMADVIDNSFHIIATVDASNLAVAARYICRTTFVDF